MAVILSSLFCSFLTSADNSLTDKLRNVWENDNLEMAINLYESITEDDLAQLDSKGLFDYHFLAGALNLNNERYDGSTQKALFHLTTAKILCDTLLGPHFDGYMGVMDGLGTIYLEQNKWEEALAIYEEGIIKSLCARGSSLKTFANLIIGVQECYERLGWFNEVPGHLMDAWSIWPTDLDLETDKTYAYYPLWELRYFYYKYGDYEKALQISENIIEYIKGRSNESHLLIADELYTKGNILEKAGDYDGAIKSHKLALNILRDNNLTNIELYGQVLGNLFMELLSTENVGDVQNTLYEIEEFGKISNDDEIYKNALFSLANNYNTNGDYDNALSIYNQLLGMSFSSIELSFLEEQKELINYSKEVTIGLPALEELYNHLEIGTKDWFEVAFKLASGYVRVKNVEKEIQVLQKLYEALQTNELAKKEYYLAVVDRLVDIYMQQEDNKKVLTYVKEQWDYVSRISNITDKYKYKLLNEIIVASLRTSDISNIDSLLLTAEPLCKNSFGTNSEFYSVFLHNQARALQLQGKLMEAKALYLKVLEMQINQSGFASKKTVQYLMELEEQIVEQELDN